MIMPGNVPLDATTVNTDLTQYLEDSWKPIIDTDIDGDSSTAATIDQTAPTSANGISLDVSPERFLWVQHPGNAATKKA